LSAEPTLRSVLDAAGAALSDVRAAAAGPTTSWARGHQVFAVFDGSSVELRLDIPIAAAAMKTPDTTVSTRGPDWVRFSPATLDGHAVDRLTAWFALGYRRAGE
jgi:hypothetical protein